MKPDQKKSRGKPVWIPDELIERVDEIVASRRAAKPWETVNRQSVVGELIVAGLDSSQLTAEQALRVAATHASVASESSVVVGDPPAAGCAYCGSPLEKPIFGSIDDAEWKAYCGRECIELHRGQLGKPAARASDLEEEGTW